MKKILILIILVFGSIIVKAQFVINKTDTHKLEVTLYHNSFYMNYRDPTTYEKIYLYDVGFEPGITYYPIKNLGFGVSGYYSFVKSDFIEFPPLMSLGVHSKYYIPCEINKKFLKRIDFFIEINIAKTNYKSTNNDSIFQTKYFGVSNAFMYNKLSQTEFNFPILGICFNVWAKLQIELLYGYKSFINGKKSIDPKIGITYYMFNK